MQMYGKSGRASGMGVRWPPAPAVRSDADLGRSTTFPVMMCASTSMQPNCLLKGRMHNCAMRMAAADQIPASISASRGGAPPKKISAIRQITGLYTAYVEMAKANGIDAVITISNEFVARADHSPVSVPKVLLRKVGLFHWSWTWIRTQCAILAHQGAVDDNEQGFLLREIQRFLNHPGTGVERFSQMGADWKELNQSVTNNSTLKKTTPEVEEGVGCWLEEERDLSLQMSRHVGQPVEAVIER